MLDVNPKFRTTRRPAAAAALLAASALLGTSAVRAELEIVGIGGDAADNIRLFSPLADEPCDAEDWRIRRRFRTLAADAREALEPFGYYAPTIETSLSRDEECWHATLTVEPGERVRLRNVNIEITGEASRDPELMELTRIPALRSGRPLRHAAYERLKRDLQVTAADHGYVQAEFTKSRIDVWPEELAADIDIEFESGPRYALGDITIEQDFLNRELVEGYMDLQPGTPFDRDEIARAYSDLSDSGYFGRIQLSPEFSAAADGRIPVTARLDSGTRIEYSIGAGASTDTGPRVRAGFRNNRLNRAGHRVRADLNVATVIQVLSGEYRQPLTDPRSDWMSYSGALSHEETDSFENEKATLGLRRTRRMTPSWIRAVGLDFSYDRFTVADVREDTFLVIPSIMFDYKTATADFYPDRGRRFTIEFAGSDESIGSSATFLQVTAWLRLVRAINEDMRVIARGTIGRIETSDFEKLPPTVRYFAGGDQTIRGFQFESIGPTNEDGDVIGGTNLLVGSLELEHRIKGNFFGALFVDAGNAYSDTEFDPVVGAGFGVKWRSPVGPVRVYLGFPIDEDDVSPRLHLGLGAEL